MFFRAPFFFLELVPLSIVTFEGRREFFLWPLALDIPLCLFFATALRSSGSGVLPPLP